MVVDSAVLAKILRTAADILDADNAAIVADEASDVEEKPKRKRRTKAEMEAAKETEVDDFDLDMAGEEKEDAADLSVDDFEDTEDAETEDEAEDEPEEKPAKKSTKKAPAKIEGATKATKMKAPTLEGDVIPAFRDFAGKHGRDKAAKLLSKYGLKSVRDLPADKYVEVIKTLKNA